jgi:hypothetical protein
VIRFFRGFLKLPLWIQLWLGVLVAFNLLWPLLFWEQTESRIIVAVFALAALLMFSLTGLIGFKRILGLGHFVWFPLLFYLWTRLGAYPVAESFGLYLRGLMAVNATSLVMDVADVVRYFRGEKADLVPGLD